MFAVPLLKVTPITELVSLMSRTVAPLGVVESTLPTRPPLATTGIPTSSP